MSPPEHQFIVIEGLDGAGKSTVAENLASLGKAHVFESPLEPLASVKNRSLQELPATARLLYFMAANLHVSEEIRKSDAGSRTVVVRYVWSTIAYHAAIEAIDVRTVVDFISPALRLVTLPEAVAFLTVGRNTQLERVAPRDEDGLQDELARSDSFQCRLRQAYAAAFECVPAPVHEIDTTSRTIHDVTERVAALMDPTR